MYGKILLFLILYHWFVYFCAIVVYALVIHLLHVVMEILTASPAVLEHLYVA